MNNKQYTFIWDLDGTLIDSYPIMLESLLELIDQYDGSKEREAILTQIKTTSVKVYLSTLAQEFQVDFDVLKGQYTTIRVEKEQHVDVMEHALDVLQWIKEQGMHNFIYTHKGASTHQILDNVSIRPLFDEVITSQNKFNRKPESDAIDYLVEKYNLDKAKTFYVGDRQIDVDCAKNAGLKSILLLDGMNEDINADYKVADLLEIIDIVK